MECYLRQCQHITVVLVSYWGVHHMKPCLVVSMCSLLMYHCNCHSQIAITLGHSSPSRCNSVWKQYRRWYVCVYRAKLRNVWLRQLRRDTNLYTVLAIEYIYV